VLNGAVGTSRSPGLVHFAHDDAGTIAGALVLRLVDGLAYVEQLSVRRAFMRQGLGQKLLRLAIEWAKDRPLWLMTYGHVLWNAPFYAREGFAIIAERDWPIGLGQLIREQREWLPDPHQRVVMRRDPSPPGQG